MPGFDTNRFTDLNESLTKHLICSICINIFDNAVRSGCEHTFCKNCVQQWIESNHKECPECRVKFRAKKRSETPRSNDNSVLIGNRVFKTNLLANSLVSDLTIKCDFEFNGCQQSIKLGLLSSHIKECPHRLCAKCGFGFIVGEEHNCIELLKKDRNDLKEKSENQLKVNEELKEKYEKQLEVNNKQKEEISGLKTKLQTNEKLFKNKKNNRIVRPKFRLNRNLSDDSDSDYTEDKERAVTSSDWTSKLLEEYEWDPCMPSTSRTRRRRNRRRFSSDEDFDYNIERREPPKGFIRRQESKKMRETIERQELEEKYNSFKELPEDFRPPNWFTDCHPKKTPYFPQMGDKVVYSRTGHQHYDRLEFDKRKSIQLTRT